VAVKNNKISKDSVTKTTVKPTKDKKGVFKVLSKIGGYFKGSWIELKQVRWPDRKSTWSLTAAVILFTAFFITLIVLLDYGFKELFKLIIK
jgi:preprotein translocase subunit SecE